MNEIATNLRAIDRKQLNSLSVSKKVPQATFREGCPLMNALIFLKKQFRKMGQFQAIRDFFDTL